MVIEERTAEDPGLSTLLEAAFAELVQRYGAEAGRRSMPRRVISSPPPTDGRSAALRCNPPDPPPEKSSGCTLTRNFAVAVWRGHWWPVWRSWRHALGTGRSDWPPGYVNRRRSRCTRNVAIRAHPAVREIRRRPALPLLRQATRLVGVVDDIDDVAVGRAYKETAHAPRFGSDRVHNLVPEAPGLFVRVLDIVGIDGDDRVLRR